MRRLKEICAFLSESSVTSIIKRQIVYFNWTGNKKLAAQLNGKFVSSEAMDEKSKVVVKKEGIFA